MSLTSKISHLIRQPLLTKKHIPLTSFFRNYAIDIDGDTNLMQTTVTMLNQEQGIFIDSYSSMGFTLNTGLKVIGPCAVFPRSILHWNIKGVKYINKESLSLFTILDPKIDIFVLGVGESENLVQLPKDIISFLLSKKISIEVLPTSQALAVFNFLNAEKRYVAAGLIPPSFVNYEDDEIYLTNPATLKIDTT